MKDSFGMVMDLIADIARNPMFAQEEIDRQKQQALSAIDRMEVRGRDSAGIHLFVWQHALDLHDPAIAAQVARRSADPLFQNGSVRRRSRPRFPNVYWAGTAKASVLM